jgi:hypothetical protein
VFEVPDGHRMVVTAGSSASSSGRLSVSLQPLEGDRPTWEWAYSMEPCGAVQLQFVRNTSLQSRWSSPLLARQHEQQQQQQQQQQHSQQAQHCLQGQYSQRGQHGLWDEEADEVFDFVI